MRWTVSLLLVILLPFAALLDESSSFQNHQQFVSTSSLKTFYHSSSWPAATATPKGSSFHESSAPQLSSAAARHALFEEKRQQRAAVEQKKKMKHNNASVVEKPYGALRSAAVKMLLLAYLASMAVMVPLSLLPQKLLSFFGCPKARRERLALETAEFWARWLLRLIPFCELRCIPPRCAEDGESTTACRPDPEPSIWVCNHTSNLDFLLLLAADYRLRGRRKRPMKIVYWKRLEKNPILKLVFRQAGFIPIEFEEHEQGKVFKTDTSSVKNFIRLSKQAFDEGFDIGILPEGQLNPHPERGTLPIFSGAHTLAKMSRRPIRMLAIHGANNLWHASKGMQPTSRQVKIRAFPPSPTTSPQDQTQSREDFVDTFEKVVGHFGRFGEDPPSYEFGEMGTATLT